MLRTTRGKKMNCQKCDKFGNHNSLHVPEHAYANYWLCNNCYDEFEKCLEKFCDNYFQPERSKREDVELDCVRIIDEVNILSPEWKMTFTNQIQ